MAARFGFALSWLQTIIVESLSAFDDDTI
jgi:hypothetical protein